MGHLWDHEVGNEKEGEFRMSAVWNKSTLASALVGLIIGGVVVGGVWMGTSRSQGAATDPVLAKVGNTPIPQSQLYTQAASSAGQQAMMQLIGNALVQQGASKYQIVASNAEVQQELKNIEAQNHITSTSQLQVALASSGMTLPDLMNNIKNQVLEQKLAVRNVQVTNQEIQTYYNQNKNQLAGTGKKPPTLASVRNTIIQNIKQSKATATSVLLAELAKQFPIQVMDKQYQGVVSQIENPAPTQVPTQGQSQGSSTATPSGSSAP
ncbi:hypothetical protein D2Q93_11535 [Alicyclobacillaceae bacterium I2511]|nr:hypothetical protein D2Q93_11535 [Alicyclobacillaceae bacterium I2511]